MNKDRYHGMDYRTITENAEKIPPNPHTKRKIYTETELHTQYHRVYFSGNFGMFCRQYQEFNKQDITKETAEYLAWAAFGYCGHQIIFYDAQENILFSIEQ